MKTRKLVSACAAITTSAILAFGFASSDANAAVVIPVTGVTIVPGNLNLQTTTFTGSGVPATAVIPAGTYTEAFIDFGTSVFTGTSATVSIGNFSSNFVKVGNTFAAPDQAAVEGFRNAFSTTGATSMSVVGSNLPNGNSALNVTFIPEPSTALLSAIGFIALLRRRR